MAKFNIKKDISLFDFADNQYKITKPIRLIELFAGIGSQAKALKNLNVDFEHHFVCEIEPQVVKTYNVIHGTNFEPTDITKISANDLNITNTDLYTYILTYSFPCQDLSLAGKGKGMEKGTGTRSSLLWEVERLLKECNELPQILLMENVPMVHSSENIKDFEKWLLFLESLGYKNYWKDLNAKNYGIPQNRDRCYMISLLNSNCDYTFPHSIRLKLRLKDMLEEKVDEKYFLSDKMIEYIVANNEKWTGNNNKSLVNKSVAFTINTGEGTRRYDASNYITEYLPEDFNLKDTDIKLIQVGNLSGGKWDKINESCRRVYDPDGLAPTIHTCQGGNTEPKIIVSGKTNSEGQRSLILDEEGICNCLSATDYKQPKQILIKEATKKGYAVAEEGAGVYLNRPQQKRGVVQKGMIQTIKCNGNDLGVVVAAAKRGRGEGWKQQIEVSDREYANAITTATKDSLVAIKVKDKVGNEIPLYTNYKKLVETVEKNEMPVDEVKHMDLYNRNLTDNCGTLSDPCHNNNRLWDGLRIRKLTPKECWRLMGFSDDDFDKAEKINSNTQLYKQAGNSIVVNVLMAIFKQFLN